MEEEWMSVQGWSGYMVSTYGRVMSKRTGIMKQNLLYPRDGIPYQVVWLWKGGMRKKFFVHRLVAMTFLDNPHDKPCVNHIDSNRCNNFLENLEWSTESENMHHWIDKKREKDLIPF